MSSPDDPDPRDRAALRAALAAPPLALAEAATTEALLATRDTPLRLHPAAGRVLRFGGHLDVACEALVHVPDQGTLGLLHLLPRGEAFLGAARRAIDTAVQLRQLLLDWAAAEGAATRALQVEVLLVVPPGTPEPAVRALAQAFDTIARRTQYLRLVGLNVLALPEGGAPPQAALRRAFCWLLKATRAWLAPARPGAADAADIAHWRLRLDDYRLDGAREFDFRGGLPRLHLVHGHNGAGKTTIVEAIELLLTERVGRLDRGQLAPAQYHSAIRHRPRAQPQPARTPASATLSVDGELLVRCTIPPDAPPRFERSTASAPVRSLSASSFRIDQNFMNDLVRASAGDRARLFLEAFAPHERATLDALEAAEAEFAESRAKLPPHLQPATPPDGTDGWLAWSDGLRPLVAGDAEPPQRWTALLALTPAELAALAPLRPGLAPLLDRLQGAPRPAALAALRQADAELAALRDALPAAVADLQAAVRVFEEFSGWQASTQVQRGRSFAADLQRWLELTALADLTRKHADVLETMHSAAAAGWQPRPRDVAGLPPPPADATAAARAREAAQALQRELNDARERLRGWQGGPQASASPSAAATSGHRNALGADEERALDRAGAWLSAARRDAPLGMLFQDALARDQVQTLAQGAIGSPGGLAAPLAQARAQLAAAEAVLARPKTQAISANAALGRIDSVLKAADALRAARSGIASTLFARLAAGGATPEGQGTQAELLAAVNELLALATPARWEYSDILLPIGRDAEGRPSMQMQAEGSARAELMLNTAELNALALVLFLLLAPRVPNPLRVLVLDDPLQNMDEMMVCTLARALAGLLAIYPAGWSVLAFFHGREDIERLRDEAPATLYHLPWARPGAMVPGTVAADGAASPAVAALTEAPATPPAVQRIGPERLAAVEALPA